QEDHVSMGTIAARHANQIVQNSIRVLSIELICALQAIDYRGSEKMAKITHQFYQLAREIVPTIKEDRIFSKDIENMYTWLKNFNWDQWMASIQSIYKEEFYNEQTI